MSSAEVTEWIAFYEVKAKQKAKAQTVPEMRSVLDALAKTGKVRKGKPRG